MPEPEEARRWTLDRDSALRDIEHVAEKGTDITRPLRVREDRVYEAEVDRVAQAIFAVDWGDEDAETVELAFLDGDSADREVAYERARAAVAVLFSDPGVEKRGIGE